MILSRRPWRTLLPGLLAASLGYADFRTAAAAPPAPIRLFDGRSFAGWNGDFEGTWRIENGEIIAGDPSKAAARNEFLATDREFEDFELRYEYRIDATEKPNAGVQFRSRRIPSHHEVVGSATETPSSSIFMAHRTPKRRMSIGTRTVRF